MKLYTTKNIVYNKKRSSKGVYIEFFYGETRIIRQAVGEGEEYIPLVLRSYELWREIEKATSTDLLTIHEILDCRQIASRFPQFKVYVST